MSWHDFDHPMTFGTSLVQVMPIPQVDLATELIDTFFPWMSHLSPGPVVHRSKVGVGFKRGEKNNIFKENCQETWKKTSHDLWCLVCHVPVSLRVSSHFKSISWHQLITGRQEAKKKSEWTPPGFLRPTGWSGVKISSTFSNFKCLKLGFIMFYLIL